MNHARVEALEDRQLFAPLAGQWINGGFAITPPGGGEAYETIKLQPSQGVVGLISARENSNGVVNWEATAVHEWTPGDKGGPRHAS